MPIARIATFLVVTSFLSTTSHLGVLVSCALDDDLSTLDILSKIRNDQSSIVRASSDFGHIVDAVPSGVFHPVSPSDIAALIRLSLFQQTPFTVAPCGKGHSSRGQALASGGIVVDMSSLTRGDHDHRVTLSVDGMYVDVGGEQLWIDVLRATLEYGLTPRVWTDYLRITIGGTLSNAGIGGQVFRHGPQISNVQELDVVTGTYRPITFHLFDQKIRQSTGAHECSKHHKLIPNGILFAAGTGDMITCSPTKSSDLFFAALGGLGQFGVITRARIGLERAPMRVKWVRLAYTDVHSFTADQELLISKASGFDYVEGQVQLNRTLTEGRRSSSFFSASELALLTELAVDTGSAAIYYIEGAMYYDDHSSAGVDQVHIHHDLFVQPNPARPSPTTR
jgi:cytokinin dehydrogenase